MLKIAKIFFLLIFLSTTFVNEANAQFRRRRSSAQDQQQAAEEKKEKERIKQEKLQEKAIKHQMKIQTKETRKRMKRNRKKSEAYDENKKQPFYKKWFTKKRKTKKPGKTFLQKIGIGNREKAKNSISYNEILQYKRNKFCVLNIC